MKLGIFGGTFNPPHIGHLIVAESVRDQLQYDKILFIPSANPPNKHDHSIASAPERLHMTRLAIQGNNNFELSDIETKRGGISYTIDTVRSLVELYPDASLSLIIGADNLLEFQTWKSPDAILSEVELVAMTRPGFTAQPQLARFSKLVTFVHVPYVAVSGTEIRLRIKMGRSIRYLVTQAVEEYILRRRLYRETD